MQVFNGGIESETATQLGNRQSRGKIKEYLSVRIDEKLERSQLGYGKIKPEFEGTNFGRRFTIGCGWTRWSCTAKLDEAFNRGISDGLDRLIGIRGQCTIGVNPYRFNDKSGPELTDGR